MERPDGDRTTDTSAPIGAGRSAEGRPRRAVPEVSAEERARPGPLSPPTYEPPAGSGVEPSRRVKPWLTTGLLLAGLFLLAGLAFFAVVPMIVLLPVAVALLVGWAIMKGLASRSGADPVTEAGKAAESRRSGP